MDLSLDLKKITVEQSVWGFGNNQHKKCNKVYWRSFMNHSVIWCVNHWNRFRSVLFSQQSTKFQIWNVQEPHPIYMTYSYRVKKENYKILNIFNTRMPLYRNRILLANARFVILSKHSNTQNAGRVLWSWMFKLQESTSQIYFTAWIISIVVTIKIYVASILRVNDQNFCACAYVLVADYSAYWMPRQPLRNSPHYV